MKGTGRHPTLRLADYIGILGYFGHVVLLRGGRAGRCVVEDTFGPGGSANPFYFFPDKKALVAFVEEEFLDPVSR